ncbi:MAG: tetratricopeptide repeat protein [Proteobacteria bacterium]|nr:tetratricopeptide repeat protein [Pseudomonadota bacterium]
MPSQTCRLLLPVCFSTFVFTGSAAAQSCPELVSYYPGESPNWPELAADLASVMPQCLDSSEFFALLGAAQLNSGLRAQAFESLERALLLNPDNGAAMVDYAQALYQEGQLFTAMELNAQLLQREDLPTGLESMLQARQQQWQSMTRQTSFQGDLMLGYDDNLNGAPDPSQITLTLSGESVLLALNPEFRPVSGPYLNIGLGARHRQLMPEHQQSWSAQLRGRISEDTDSDLLQLDGRYAFIRPRRDRSWQVDGAVRNLFFGGSALFTASEVRARYSTASAFACKPYYDLILQHQLFHDQSHLNALDSRASVGLSCPLNGSLTGLISDVTGLSGGAQRLNLELGALNSQAIKTTRPGGDRQGWQFTADWEYRFSMGTFRALLNHTELDDRKTYSPLLINGAERWLKRSYVLFQYRQPIDFYGNTADLVVNLYRQRQRSNIELFETNDSTFEIGLSFAF